MRFPIVIGAGLGLVVLLFAAGVSAAELNDRATLLDTVPPSALPERPTQVAPAIDDLPLMPGLTPVPDEDMVFLTRRDGRIAESVTQGLVDIDEVYKFYRRSLPQLGWRVVDGRSYERNGEILRIDAHADSKLSTVRFTVNPK